MSDQVSRGQRWSHRRLASKTAVAGAAVAFVVTAGLAASWIGTTLRSPSVALASLIDFDWPRWIHNLADALQIATPLVAILVWGSTRRRRR